MWSEWPDDATHNRLTPDWSFYQRRGGHRTSTDDLITAWFAAQHAPEASSHLDLGCGIGSVLLMTHYLVRPAFSVGVEAQEQSATMALRSVRELPERRDITIVRSDFREFRDERGPYELITGSPPYFPPGTGVPSPDPQRHACRFELRGGIEDYCSCAAPLLQPGGAFVVVFPSAQHDRLCAAAAAAGLHEHARLDTWMREDDELPFLSVHLLRREPPGAPALTQRLTVRDAEGRGTAAYRSLRASFGW